MRVGHRDKWSYNSFPRGAKPVTYRGDDYDLDELAMERAFPSNNNARPDGEESIDRLVALGILPPRKIGGTVEVVQIPQSHVSHRQEFARRLGDGTHKPRPSVTSYYWTYRTRRAV